MLFNLRVTSLRGSDYDFYKEKLTAEEIKALLDQYIQKQEIYQEKRHVLKISIHTGEN